MRTRIAATLIVIFTLTAATGAAQPLAERLPAQTLAYIGWAGTESLEFDGSVFGQLLKEPVVGKILDAARQETRKKAPQWGDAAWAIAGIAWRRPLAVAVLDLQVSQQGPAPTAVLLIDLGEQKEAFAAHLDAILQTLGAEALPWTDATVASVTYKLLRRDGAPDIAMGYIDHVFFWALGPDAAKRLIETTPAQSLKVDKAFAACMAAASGDNELTAFYVDLAAFRRLLEPLAAGALAAHQDGPTPRHVWQALGLGKVTVLAGATRIVDKGMYTKVRLFSPAPHRGVLLPLAGAALSAADLAGVPADADFVAVAKLSPAALYTEIRDIVKTLSPQSDMRLEAALAIAEAQVGVTLENDLLNNIGDTWVLSCASSQGGFLTGTVLSVQLKDAKAFSAAAEKLETFCKAQLSHQGATTIETVKVGRTDIRYIALSGVPFPVAPAWAVHEDKFYVALYPQVVEAAIGNYGQELLAKDAEFAKWRSHVGEQVSILRYVNTPRIIRQLYNLTLVGWTTAASTIPQAEGIPRLRADWMPSLAKLEKYFQPLVSAVSTDADGITMEQYGSIPILSASCFGAALASCHELAHRQMRAAAVPPPAPKALAPSEF